MTKLCYFRNIFIFLFIFFETVFVSIVPDALDLALVDQTGFKLKEIYPLCLSCAVIKGMYHQSLA